jgi:hypothetical protein
MLHFHTCRARAHTHTHTQVPEALSGCVEKLRTLFNIYLETSIEFVRLNILEMNKTVDSNLCFSMIKLLRTFFEPFVTREGVEVCHMHSVL